MNEYDIKDFIENEVMDLSSSEIADKYFQDISDDNPVTYPLITRCSCEGDKIKHLEIQDHDRKEWQVFIDDLGCIDVYPGDVIVIHKQIKEVDTKELKALCIEFVAYEDSDKYIGRCVEYIVGDIARAIQGWERIGK